VGPGRGSAPAGVYPLLVCVMAVWGLNIPAVKVLTGVMDPVWVAVVRLVIACGVLCLLVFVRAWRWPRLTRRQWLWLSAGGLLMIYANQLLFARGLGLASSTNVSLLMAMTPSMSLAAAALAFRERVDRRLGAGIALGFAGVALVAVNAPGAGVVLPGIGELLVLLGLVVFVGGGLIVQRLGGELDAVTVAWGLYLVGTLMLCVHAAFFGGAAEAAAALASPLVWACVLYSGVLGTALSNVAWYHAIARVGVGRAGSLFYLLPIFGVAFSVLLLGEEPSSWHGIGLVLVLLGTRLSLPRPLPG
jgi:drug/metabolite transporter (DMT)-like permease